MHIRRLLLLLLMSFCFLGFERNYDMVHWKGISKESPLLYLKADDDFINNLNVAYNDLDYEDTLGYLYGSDLAKGILLRVAEQFNAISTSYLRLVPWGETIPGVLETFDESQTTDRVVDIKLTTFSNPFIGGESQSKFDGSNVTNCYISIDRTRAYSIKEMLHLLVHETAHCVGLGHTHGDKHSVLAYDAPFDNYSLSGDDMSGVTALYPAEQRFVKQTQTFGLTGCVKR